MKKSKFKNCIAFTLAEMTLVLLITSIIAAASTPMITSAISGANSEKGSDLGATFDTPWKTASSYNGGGIYNSPRYTYSIVTVGNGPRSNADRTIPASLIVHQNSTSALESAPQIKIAPNTADSYANIAMDAFQSVGITTGTSLTLPSFANVKQAGVFLGSFIKPMSYHANNIISSTFIGHNINSAITHYSVLAGSNIRSDVNISSLFMGNQILSNNHKGTFDSIIVGYYAGYASYGSYNVIMGSYAAYAAEASQNIMVGNYAGYNFADSNGNSMVSANNIIMGNYAGYTTKLSSAPGSSGYAFNTYIGKYAGAFLGSTSGGSKTDHPNTARVFMRNVAIGNYAGLHDFGTAPVLALADSIYIGDYAGYTKTYNLSGAVNKYRRICIGAHACHNEQVDLAPNVTGESKNDWQPRSRLGDDSIYIGSYAGKESGDIGLNIAIGTEAGASTYSRSFYSKYAISIGSRAGYGSNSLYSIFIGHEAGLNSKNNETFSLYYDYPNKLANVGIGRYTCQNITFGGKWCLGGGTLTDTLYYTTPTARGENPANPHPSYKVWSTDDFGQQMVIGFVNKGIYKQNIVFYASKIIKGGWNSQNLNSEEIMVPAGTSNYKLSDRRYKKDIVPTTRSIKDIRKINIYDFNYKNDADKKTHTGIIAQEYKKIFPYDVSVEPTTKKLSAASDWLMYTLIVAVKDLDKEIISLQNDVKTYIKGFMGLKAKVDKLEKQAEKIKAENIEMKNHLAKINAKLK